MKKINTSVIIIGAGLGGLISAAYLSKRGAKVSVFEKLPKVGGVLGTFKRGNYLFEASTHQIGGFTTDNYIKQYLNFLDINKLEVIKMSELYECFFVKNDKIHDRYILPAGKAALKEKLIKYFPDNKKQIVKYLKLLEMIGKDFLRISRVLREEKKFHILYDVLTAIMLEKGREGSLIKTIGKFSYQNLVKFINFNYQDIISFIKNEKLKSILSQYWMYSGLPPSEVSGTLMSIYYYFYAFNSPLQIKYGTKTLLDRLVDIISNNGGKIYCNTPIKKILIHKGKALGVVTEKDEEYKSDFVISNISSYRTFIDLIGEKYLPGEYCKNIKNIKLSTSLFMIYVGLPLVLDDFDIKASTNFFNFNYDQNQNYKNSFNGPSQNSPFTITNYSKLDKSFAPEGCSSLVIIELDNYKRWEKLENNEYIAMKERTQNLIIDKVERILKIPIREKAEVLFSATPKTIQHYMSNLQGEVFGPANYIDQTFTLRTPHQTPIVNLFLAGAYTQPTSGVSAVVDSGVNAVTTLVNSLKRSHYNNI